MSATPVLPIDDADPDAEHAPLRSAVSRWTAVAAILTGVWGLAYAVVIELLWAKRSDPGGRGAGLGVLLLYGSFVGSSTCWLVGGAWLLLRQRPRNVVLLLAALFTLTNLAGYVFVFGSYWNDVGPSPARALQLLAALSQFAHTLPLVAVVLWSKKAVTPSAVVRWLATVAIALGIYTLLILLLPEAFNRLRSVSLAVIRHRIADLGLLFAAAAVLCTIVGGVWLARRRVSGPTLLRVAASMWLAASAVNAYDTLHRLTGVPEAWWVVAQEAYAMILGAPFGIFFAVATLVILRRKEVRAMFMPNAVRGFRPIFKAQEPAGAWHRA
jgi:hypothetical protein